MPDKSIVCKPAFGTILDMAIFNKTIKVGVIGLGRSGWGIHIEDFRSMRDLYTVVAVHDVWPERLRDSATAIEARAHTSLDSFLADPNIELVVVASPSKFHYQQALAALEAGKHVLCDKPFGTTVEQVDALINAATKVGRVLQPFQQRRYEPDFQKVLEVVRSGVLGRIQMVRICWHGFKRRWDWQTMSSMAGGELYNNGPHPIDHAMFLLGDSDDTPVTPDVWCERRRCLASGDGEDHVKLILSASGKPTVEIELSSTIAYGQDRWLISGTAGGLRGSANGLEWKWVDWSKMPDRPLDPNPTPDRSYNGEKLEWQQATWVPAGAVDAGGGSAPAWQPVNDLYTDFHATLTTGAAQKITPQSVRRRVDILERASKLAPVIG